MKLNHLMLTSVLALSLLGSAACSSTEDSSGSAVGDPGAGSGAVDPGTGSGSGAADPGAGGGETKTEPEPVAPGGGGDVETLDDALAGHGETERINFQVLAEDCGQSAVCLEELEALKAYITDCADCSPVLANFNDEATSAQLRSGTLPTTYPQVKDVVLASADAAAGGESGDAGASGDTGAAGAADAAIDDLVADLNKMAGEETTWNQILDMVDPANKAAVEEAVTDALANMTDDETAKALLAGDPVSAEDAAAAIESATANP